MNISALDRNFSTYIRLRDSDSNGLCRCISCGKIHHYLDIHCGHFVNRKHMSTRFDEKNCNAQCCSCNTYDEGNPAGYAKGLVAKYGADIIDLLLFKKSQTSKLSQFEVNQLNKYYIAEIKRLKHEKSI